MGIGGCPLLDNVTFQIEKGERICLLGRNGVGKSTLLKILNHEMAPDSGEVWRQQGVKIAALQQDVPNRPIKPYLMLWPWKWVILAGH